MNHLLRNLLHIVVPVVLCTLLSLILNRNGLLVSSNWLYGVLFLVLLTFTLNLVYTAKAGTKDYTQLLLGAIVIKLLVVLSAIVTYSFFLAKPLFFNFAIQFTAHFILFTIFEIRYLLFLIKIHPFKHT